MKAKKYIKSTDSLVAVKKYFNIKVIASLVASLMLLYASVALYNYTKENGTLLYNVAEAQITSTVPIVKGKIKTEAEVEETSSYDVGNGFEDAQNSGSLNYTGYSDNNTSHNNRPSSTPTYNQQINNSNTQQTIDQIQKDLSFLKGTSISMIEGESFDPIANLGIVAHDKDGTDITARVSIDENNVDVNNEGSYYVKASVKLNDGSTLEKVFTVKVNPKKEVTYEVNNFEMLEKAAPKLGTARIFFDSKVSDETVSPLKATINGVEYNINYFGKSGFGGTTRHYIDVNVGDISGEFKLNVEKIEFSNGVSVWPGKQMNVYVIKSEPVVSNFSYTEGEEGKISTTFDLKDLDNSLSNIKVSLYDEKGILVEEYKVAKKEKYNLDFSVEANGKYTLEVIGDVNLYDDLSRLNQSRVILSEDIQVSNIVDKTESTTVDNSKLDANDVEISVGEELNVGDLNIIALDKNGEDISSKVEIDTSKLDITNAGEYEVLLTVVNSDNIKLEEIVNVNVVSKIYEKDMASSTSLRTKNAYNQVSADSQNQNEKNISMSRTIVSGSDSASRHSSVNIPGAVYKGSGEAPNGIIQVELPVDMSFMIDKEGRFNTAGAYSIVNKSSCDIDLMVESFTETNPQGGIIVKKEDVKDTDPRNEVNLYLTGNTSTATLYSGKTLGIKIAEIKKQSQENLVLTGKAGKGQDTDVDSKGANETFVVTFKVSKKTN